MTITLEVREPAPVGRSVERTKLPTGVMVHKDRNGNIVRLISPQRNSTPLHYTVAQTFTLASRIASHRNKYSNN